MIQKPVTFRQEEVQLAGLLRLPDETGKFPAIILCHGLRGNKDREFMRDLAMELTYTGFATFAFDFFGHGESQGNFERMTITEELKDLDAAFQFVKTLPEIDAKRIAIVGHSLGGMISSLYVAEQYKKEIKALGIIASYSDFQKAWSSFFNEDELLQWRKEGSILLQGSYPIRKDLLLDSEHYNILARIEEVTCPTLIIHGTADMRVPLEEAKILLSRLQCQKQLEVVEGANHDFADRNQRKDLIERLIQWLRKVV